MSDPGVHPIGSIDDAVEHLIHGPDHDAGDSASGLIDLFNDFVPGFLTDSWYGAGVPRNTPRLPGKRK
jgi:hypothetical protein